MRRIGIFVTVYLLALHLLVVVIFVAISTHVIDPFYQADTWVEWLHLWLAIPLTAVLVSAFFILRHREKRWFLFLNGLILTQWLFVLLVGEIIGRGFAPSWPALGLHGVHVTDWKQWTKGRLEGEAVGINDWGQHDKERDRTKPVSRRIAFVGDSFLEEHPWLPLNVEVENRLSDKNLEIINLGVSATSPDEYYYRIKNIALPLGVDEIFLFYYLGNDLEPKMFTLESYLGLAAVYPRDSLLSSLHLLGLNHLFTQKRRPLVQIWHEAGDLLESEKAIEKRFQETTGDAFRLALVDLVHPNFRKNLDEILKRMDMMSIEAFLKNPDRGLFRSYYIKNALRLLAKGKKAHLFETAFAEFWLTQVKRLCDKNSVLLTLVLIPEASQVDDRFFQQWQALFDVRYEFHQTLLAAMKLRVAASKKSINVLDLHDEMMSLRGTYLNLDGHWSPKGVAVAANILAKAIKSE